jgi:hypothetical protein
VSLLLSWVLFPIVLALIGAGWGVLVERAAGTSVAEALLLPVGLASALVAGGTLTAFDATARAAVPVVLVGAGAGVALAVRAKRRLARWPLLVALGVLLTYGAPVLLSGHATFLGFVRLDDTATWFDAIDHVMAHSRSVAHEPPSTYSLVFSGLGPVYPLGAFVLPGVARAALGVDIAWVYQPYLACCAAALGLCIYALVAPVIASPRLRALLAYLGAQPALLYGYSMWGGIKELTAAFLLALGVALASALVSRRPAGWRGLVPLAVAVGALIQTLGVGAAGWVVPAPLFVVVAWRLQPAPRDAARSRALSIAWLIALSAACVVPVWVVLRKTLANNHLALEPLLASGQSAAEDLGNLLHPLSVFQLAGIWPVGDFRVTAPTLPSTLLIGLCVVAAAGALLVTFARRELGVWLYLAIALTGCAVVSLLGSTPWVIGKALAISSPALLTCALAGGGLLWARRRALGGIVLLVLAGGVVWSNALAYHDALLAPRARLAELQHIGGLLAGRGPTFVSAYEIYADRHFLRAGAPVAPAEYRSVDLPLRDGALLTKSAWADLDSFAVSTLLPYRSIVTPRSPAESRPPSVYRRVYAGRYYELWQRPARPSSRILLHVPLGESNRLPYCGAASNLPARPLCSANPVAVPPCTELQRLAAFAAGRGARIVAYERPEPIVARGDQTLWPARWLHEPGSRTLRPDAPGTAVTHIRVNGNQRYVLWLGGSFARGLQVAIDGGKPTTVKDELAIFGGYAPVAVSSLSPGVHTIALTYPHANLTPGSGDNASTELTSIVLQPLDSPRTRLVSVAPAGARELCGRSLDWVEVVAPASG